MARKTLMTILAILVGMGIWVSNLQGQNYPTRPIEILCPYSAGSATDINLRFFADIAQKYLEQPIVVINKPGANGGIMAAEVISSKPDGYKLGMLSNTHVGYALKTIKLPFNPNDLEPLGCFYEAKHGLSVKGDSPWKSLNDLLGYARENPGKLKWGHVGRGGTQHIYGLLIFKKIGVETTDLPFKGTPEQVSAILGGHIDVSVMTYAPVRDLLKTGRLRYLAVFNRQRYSDLPNVPSVAELGFQEAGELKTIWGLWSHKNTSEEIKKTLRETFRKTYEDPELKKGIEKIGEEPNFAGPELMNEAIKRAEDAGVPMLKELGLYKGR